MFTLWFLGIFFLSFFFLWAIGATPTAREVEEVLESGAHTVTVPAQTPENPLRVKAPSIGLDERIENPESSDIAVLDRALLKGAVRYPQSARLGEEGNVLLFGHSSYLRTTLNSAYKSFNDIQKLRTGDTISVYSNTAEFRYRVTSVRHAKAEEDFIDLGRNGKRLTLVTCNSFGTKSDRFIVEAEFVGAGGTGGVSGAGSS